MDKRNQCLLFSYESLCYSTDSDAYNGDDEVELSKFGTLKNKSYTKVGAHEWAKNAIE
jgi:hypothetical protein